MFEKKCHQTQIVCCIDRNTELRGFGSAKIIIYVGLTIYNAIEKNCNCLYQNLKLTYQCNTSISG